MSQYALIADVHGNIWALEAVLNDIRRRGISQLLNLGDTLYGPLEPQATADCLMALDPLSVQGNEDRILRETFLAAKIPTLAYALGQLTPASLAWIAAQPFTAVVGECFLCHGTPQSDTTYLLEDVSRYDSFLAAETLVQERLATVRQPVVLCGHSHTPHTVALADGRLVVNPGSVGLPAYTDDQPAHRMQVGSPHARYAVLTPGEAGWVVEQIAVPYPWQKAAQRARQNGRGDWAAWLESGRA